MSEAMRLCHSDGGHARRWGCRESGDFRILRIAAKPMRKSRLSLHENLAEAQLLAPTIVELGGRGRVGHLRRLLQRAPVS